MAHAKHIKGDRAELIAAEHFISLGYSVHRSHRIPLLNQRCTNVGTVIRKGNSMRSMIWVGLMMVLLTACTKVDFDGFDPATSAVKWIITGNKK